MIIILSSAKTMDFAPSVHNHEHQDSLFPTQREFLLHKCKKLDEIDIKSLMSVSSKIAQQNYERFQNFEHQTTKPAILAYDGDVFKQLDRLNYDSSNLSFANQHICIISGLYGALRSMDSIKPYRLEMAVKLINNQELSEFWKRDITTYINESLHSHQSKYLINLASREYSSAIEQSQLLYPMINIFFKEYRNGEYKIVGINSKRARGMMVDYIIKNAIDNPDDLKAFRFSDYSFNKPMSDNLNYVFVK